jgi:HPr kinase/phosphorylase
VAADRPVTPPAAGGRDRDAAPGPGTYIHATALAIGEAGILIRGPSGSGKSRLALELIAEASRRGVFARLVGDDRVALAGRAGRLIARGHPTIAGQIESRGEGVLKLGYEGAVVIRLLVDLGGQSLAAPERMPQAETTRSSLCGLALPRLTLEGPEPHHAGIVLDYLLRMGNG